MKKLKLKDAMDHLMVLHILARQYFSEKRYNESAKLYVKIARMVNQWDKIVLPEDKPKEEKRKEPINTNQEDVPLVEDTNDSGR